MPAKTPMVHWPDHPRPSHRGTTPGTAMRPQTRTMTTTTTPCTRTCRDCVVVRQMPVCNAGGNASAMRAKRPAQRGQQRQRNAGNNNSAMLARTPARRGQGRQRNTGKTTSARLAGHEGQVARERRRLRQQKLQTMTMSLVTTLRMLTFQDCVMTGQTPVRNADGNAGATWVMSPAQQGQRCPRDEGSDAQHRRRQQRDAGDTASAMRARMPAQCQQRHQRCIGWSIGDQISWEQS
jgi:hypothetical protein